MVDFIEERILGGIRAVPNGTGTLVRLGPQDCASLVRGYLRFSLREKSGTTNSGRKSEATKFHPAVGWLRRWTTGALLNSTQAVSGFGGWLSGSTGGGRDAGC